MVIHRAGSGTVGKGDMSVSVQIREILAEQALLTLEDVSESFSLADLGIDSLGIVEVIFSIEEAFGIQVPFNANDPKKSSFDISSVDTITRAVEQLISEQAG